MGSGICSCSHLMSVCDFLIPQAQITIMTSHRSDFHNMDITGYQELCRKLELTLEHHSEPATAWILYRRVLLIFTQVSC